MSETTPTELGSADIQDLLEALPHRYPFLLVDKLKEIDSNKSCIGIKNVTANEPHFMGHFPGQPVMPGVLMLEGMAQTAGALCILARAEGSPPSLVYLMSIDKAKFRKPVVPGDQIEYHVKMVQSRGSVWKFSCKAMVEGKKVCEAEISAMLLDQ
ncbi:MAG: 3-hydroxyacyl-[acyl-carrier-protein] dehydratase FabZ [Hyphomicrobiales bacterium]|nr:3-hydroxyacyl-ACP dehydratase FabZ [Hyphomicrobiales bacterium]PCJ89811.1 MAG: 3-hydroxyacyl-[acyl-carrier-protein] dehydratase FabZ [Hyphomicrobiales bacterium]